eukprot:TRINITY_DN564_c0_g1_i1.p1 TRINITY_DN564_c0_g1~~TRINITY_DN564_c0_g1_i1.p1  ORF type:complete len:393 (-),score=189.57 TRINITY_DN564_c0_g1_i1:134-1312(-)
MKSSIKSFSFLNQKTFISRQFTTKTLPFFQGKQLSIEKTSIFKPKPETSTLKFGQNFSDHMLSIQWDIKSGWEAPKITPYQNLQLDPSSSSLHYALQLFEGMKAYKDNNNQIRLFRPDKNMERMNITARRLHFPNFDGDELIKCTSELLNIDESWIPQKYGYSMYIRPTMISNGSGLGVGPANRVLLYVITGPVGPYYPDGFKPIGLYAESSNVRAWPGGTGSFKIGANYAPTIEPQAVASKKGYSQVLWLLGSNHEITEVGTMNFFTLIKDKNGDLELITPPLDGTILPGVTRLSILELCKSWNEFKVSERKITMHEFLTAHAEGRIVEAFGAGTAAIVAPIKLLCFKDKEYHIPLSKNQNFGAGDLAARLMDHILKIQFGEISSPWSVVV